MPPLLAYERVPSFSFDRVYSPVFADMVMNHREDVVPDKVTDYTVEAIALVRVILLFRMHICVLLLGNLARVQKHM